MLTNVGNTTVELLKVEKKHVKNVLYKLYFQILYNINN